MSNVSQLVKMLHFIDGVHFEEKGGDLFDLRDPETDGVIASVAKGSAATIDLAVQAAHRAFQSYRSVTAAQREIWLCEAVRLIEQHREEFVDILVRQSGSPITKARFEVRAALENIRASIGLVRQAQGATIPSDTVNKLSMTFRTPIGVIAGITPFNVPFITASRAAANALALGNTIVILPSEEVPGIALRMAALFHQAGFPPGTINVVTGFGYEIGDALTTHPLVQAVKFTGSTVIGTHIRKLCGQHGKRVTLELGGKSPLLIMADADLDKAVAAAVRSIFFYQGQICLGASRIFVERSIFEPFIEKFSAAAEAVSIGDMRDEKTLVGPTISDRQRKRIRDHIADASAKGAKVVTGGEWIRNRCQPTILTGVTPDMVIYGSETFGPVASVYPVDSFEEGLTRANETDYGLTSGIFTSNLGHAMAFVRGINAGMVHVNAQTVYDEPHAPFGGVKDSGFGREGTESDLHTWTDLKWATIQL